jgi:hypothetical protein
MTDRKTRLQLPVVEVDRAGLRLEEFVTQCLKEAVPKDPTMINTPQAALARVTDAIAHHWGNDLMVIKNSLVGPLSSENIPIRQEVFIQSLGKIRKGEEYERLWSLLPEIVGVRYDEIISFAKEHNLHNYRDLTGLIEPCSKFVYNAWEFVTGGIDNPASAKGKTFKK